MPHVRATTTSNDVTNDVIMTSWLLFTPLSYDTTPLSAPWWHHVQSRLSVISQWCHGSSPCLIQILSRHGSSPCLIQILSHDRHNSHDCPCFPSIVTVPSRGHILYAIYGNSTCIINHIVVTAIDKMYHNYYISTPWPSNQWEDAHAPFLYSMSHVRACDRSHVVSHSHVTQNTLFYTHC